MTRFHSFLWLSDIPLCVCVCVCVYITHLLYPFSVDGHLGCFHVLAIVNSTTVSIEVRVFLFELWFSLGICAGVELPG